MPNGWQVVPLRQVCERVRDKNSAGVDRVLSVVAGRGLVEQEKYFNRRVAAKNLSGYTVVKPGDLVYNKSYSATAPWGVVALNRGSQAGVVSPLYIVFRPSGSSVDGQFLELAATSVTTTHSLAGLVKEGGRAHGGINISLDDFFSVLLPLPSIDEQRRIVDLVASIDSCIDRLQTQAEATRAARSALLAELLTDPGDDWEETTLGDLANWFSGGTPKSTNAAYYRNGTIHWAIIADLLNDPVVQTAKHISDAGLAAIGGRLAPAGSVLVSMYGTIARTAVAGVPLATNQAIAWAEPHADVCHSAFLRLLVDQLRPEFERAARGAAQKNINRGMIRNAGVTLPPLEVQRRILDLTSAFDDQIARLQSQFAAAQNVRAVVLSELLSGERLLDESYDVAVPL